MAAGLRLGRLPGERPRYQFLHVDLPAGRSSERHAQSPEVQAQLIRGIVTLMEKEGVAYDIASYRDAPPGLRLWGGATVESGDMEAVLSWLDWAFDRATAGWSAI